MRTKTFATVALLILALGSLSADGYRRSQWYRSDAMIPAGTSMDVRLSSKISTEDARPGDSWTGIVDQSVRSGGRVMIPAGSPVDGEVTSAAQGTHDNRARLDLMVRRVTVDGRSYVMNADTEPIIAGTKRAKKIGAIVGGAAAGALLGHAVAKDHHGALIGGLVGGAAGYGLTRHALRTLQLKPGTVVTFTTREDVLARR